MRLGSNGSLLAIAVTVSFLGCGASSPPVVCAPGAPPPATPSADDAALTNEQVAEKLLALTGAENTGKQVMDAMVENLRKVPGLVPGFMDRFIANARPEELTALVVPIYVANFDRATMLAAIHFYESKEGRDLVMHLPVATKESIAAGQSWGRTLAEKTMADLNAGVGAQP